MKRLICLLMIVLFTGVVTPSAHAAAQDYYTQQEKQSGALELPGSLPQETQNSLGDLGVNGANWQQITSITPESLFQQIGGMTQENATEPLHAAASVVAIMILCALCSAMKLSFEDRPFSNVIGMVGTLCICTAVIHPIVACVESAAQAVKAASGFLLACIPVLTGIMAAAGQPISASSFHLLMIAAGNVISFLSAHLLVPFLNIYLALSIVSAVSPGINLSGLCNAFDKTVKWTLGFCMTVFTGLLTMHSIVATSLDTTGTRAARFVVSSFVPVVGNALGEALNTITGCVKMLKSGVSAFTLLAGLMLFLPVILRCLVWMGVLTMCSGIGDVFELKQITKLLQASCKVVQTMLSILLCCMAILTVSTVVMLIIGGVGS